ncbi:MAG: hypothetical protein FWC47_05545 [Oscillospiraceae bacterium]|nr:hypothetical protein [Oscillospiraceae bacterium]
MKRMFFSNKNSCDANCSYCFAKWAQYNKCVSYDYNLISDDGLIIYPNCDGNIFDDNFQTIIESILKVKKKIVVSISTKHDIDDIKIDKLKSLNDYLKKNCLGFVKISISFSCISLISDIEKNTLLYHERIALAEKISTSKLNYATILKPILPFINFDEYKKIVDDTIQISPYYMIDGLYVDEDTEFYNKYIKDKYPLCEKTIEWLQDRPLWKYIDSTDTKRLISDYIFEKNGVCFYSDLELIKYLCK